MTEILIQEPKNLDLYPIDVFKRQGERLRKQLNDFDKETSCLNEKEASLHKDLDRIGEDLHSWQSEQSIWSTAKRVFDYVQNTSMLCAAGVAGLSTSTGILFFAAGSLGLGNRLIQDITGWKPIAEKISHEDNADSLEKTAQLTSFGMTVLASFIGKNYLQNIAGIYGKAMSVSYSFVQGIIYVRNEYVKGQLAYAQAKQQEIKEKVSQIGDAMTEQASNWIEESQLRQRLVQAASSSMWD